MSGRVFAFVLVAASLIGCGDPAPTSPATLAGQIMLASQAELSATSDAPATAGTALVKSEPER